MVFTLPYVTLQNVIGFSDDSDDDEEDGSESDESIDITDINSNVNFFPITVDGLVERFHPLFAEFMREGKHVHRNEIGFLLDGLLRQEGINRDEYIQINDKFGESIDKRDDDDEEEEMDINAEEIGADADDVVGGVTKMIQTPHDKKELISRA